MFETLTKCKAPGKARTVQWIVSITFAGIGTVLGILFSTNILYTKNYDYVMEGFRRRATEVNDTLFFILVPILTLIVVRLCFEFGYIAVYSLNKNFDDQHLES